MELQKDAKKAKKEFREQVVTQSVTRDQEWRAFLKA